MSLEGDISSWVESRLDTQVAALREVKAIASPEEFQLICSNPPSAGVLVFAGRAVDSSQDLDANQLIEIKVGIWVSSVAFRSDEDFAAATTGIYVLRGAIHTALKNQIPTGAASPLRYESHDLDEFDNGLAIMVMEYTTLAII